MRPSGSKIQIRVKNMSVVLSLLDEVVTWQVSEVSEDATKAERAAWRNGYV